MTRSAATLADGHIRKFHPLPFPAPYSAAENEGKTTVMQHLSKFGIYLNAAEGKVVRINSPYWFPEEPDWLLLTSEVNATLLQIRELAREQGTSPDPDAITWGRIPLLD